MVDRKRPLLNLWLESIISGAKIILGSRRENSLGIDSGQIYFPSLYLDKVVALIACLLYLERLFEYPINFIYAAQWCTYIRDRHCVCPRVNKRSENVGGRSSTFATKSCKNTNGWRWCYAISWISLIVHCEICDYIDHESYQD